MDNDEAGQIAAKALIEYFDENNINYCTFDNCGYKDANQALVSDKEKFTEEINKIVFPLIKEREHRKARQFDDILTKLLEERKARKKKRESDMEM